MKPRANERQQRRAERDHADFYCSWGRHKTFRHPELKEQYAYGTICIGCQSEIAGNLERVVFMPQLSEALLRQKRALWEARRRNALYEGTLRATDPDSNGIIYYLLINGQIKIGYTTDLTQRSRSYPPGSELLAVEPGTKDRERERHIQFQRYLTRGREWFVDADDIRKLTMELRYIYGLPEFLMHKYTKHRAIEGAQSA